MWLMRHTILLGIIPMGRGQALIALALAPCMNSLAKIQQLDPSGNIRTTYMPPRIPNANAKVERALARNHF